MSSQSLLTRCPIVPVVVIHDAAQAVPLGEALLAGGVDVVEITLRTAAGIEAIRILAAALPALQVGAGSVLVPAQVDEVVDAGAQFVVSPGLSVVPAVSGSWMVAESLLAEGRWDEVTRRSAAAVTAARQTRGSSLTSVSPLPFLRW